MAKRMVVLVLCILIYMTGCLVLCILIYMTGCDPYSGQRPYDYGNAVWVCDELDMRFVVDTDNETYVTTDGELQNNGAAYFCEFVFERDTNELDVYIYSFEYGVVFKYYRGKGKRLADIEGDCAFSEDSFVYTIDSVSVDSYVYVTDPITAKSVEDMLDDMPKTLTFRRIAVFEYQKP